MFTVPTFNSLVCVQGTHLSTAFSNVCKSTVSVEMCRISICFCFFFSLACSYKWLSTVASDSPYWYRLSGNGETEMHKSTVATAPDQHRVESFQSSQRYFKREADLAASSDSLLLHLNTCLRWLAWVIEGQSEGGHSEPCLWQKVPVT